jgi:hypothetical protein
MKPNWLTLTTIIVGLGLLLHAGCEEQAAAPQQLSSDWFDRFQQPSGPKVTSTAGRPSPSRLSPTITFEKLMHDFGNVGPGTSHLSEFKFTNTGDGILRIGEIGKTCGCTPFSLAKRDYAPGESGTLKVQYYSDTQRGSTAKQLFVYSNDKAQPEVALTIKATIITKVAYEPKTLNLLLKHENAGCPGITLSSIDNQPFSISSFKSTANFITADFNPSVKATSFVLQPKVDMAKLEKTLYGRIEVGLTHPECNVITVGVSTLPRFSVSPRSIIVRGVEPQRTIVKRLRITNNYKENFELESASSKKGIVRVQSNKAIRDGYELELEVTPPPAGSRARMFTEVFSVNLKGGRKLEIPCSGFYVGSAASSRTARQNEKECKVCGPKVIDPATGKVTTYSAAGTKSGS